jgi:hypothetical protein
MGPGFDSAFNRNEYQESSREVKGCWLIRLTICEPNVYNMWEHQHLTSWASMACYRDNFPSFMFFIKLKLVSMLARNLITLVNE